MALPDGIIHQKRVSCQTDHLMGWWRYKAMEKERK